MALGDWGEEQDSVKHLALTMKRVAKRLQPSFILALGDNFYPNGASSPDDPIFQTVWEHQFLCYDELWVPWKVVLGNHDYQGLHPEAEIDFTISPRNPLGVWQTRGSADEAPSCNYHFSHELGHGATVTFEALDSNAAQHSVAWNYPSLKTSFLEEKAAMEARLQASSSLWKVLYCHHPMYTKSNSHGVVGDVLRKEEDGLGSGGLLHPGRGGYCSCWA
jgi:hypothetical protein